MNLDNNLWIFIHLSKSGGTTIKAHFYKHLNWDIDFIEMSNWGESYRQKNNRLPLDKRNLKDREKVRVIAGHKTYYGIHKHIPHKKPLYFTVIREPAERCISMYNFHYSRGQIDKDFHSWYEKNYKQKYKNPIVKFYARQYSGSSSLPYDAINLELAKKFLDICWHVGITKNLNQDLQYIFSAMQLPIYWKNYRQAGNPESNIDDLKSHPRTKLENIHKHQKLTREIEEQIHHDYPLDYTLYMYATNLNIRRKK